MSMKAKDDEPPRHIHEWLEDLFYSMFERRFINLTPTRILPSYLNIHLTGVTAGKPVKMPMPDPGTIYGGMEDEYDDDGGGSTADEGTVLTPRVTKRPEELASSAAPQQAPSVSRPLTLDVPSQTPPDAVTSPGGGRGPATPLTLLTDVPPPTFNPLSATTSSASVSPNILVDDVDPMDKIDLQQQQPQPQHRSSLSRPSSPPVLPQLSHMSTQATYNSVLARRDSAKGPGGRILGRGVGSSASSPPESVQSYGRRPVKLAGKVFDLQEHEMVGSSAPEEIIIDTVATIPGRARAPSATSGSGSVERSSDDKTPKEENGGESKKEKKKKKPRPPLKFILATQALTMMLVKQFGGEFLSYD